MTTNSSFFELPVMDSDWTDPSSYENTGNSFVADREAFMVGKDKFSNPTKKNTTPWTDPGAYENTGESFMGELFVDSGNKESNWGGDIWDWANTEQGSTVIGGAIGGVDKAWSIGRETDALENRANSNMAITQMKIDANMAMQEKQIAAAKEIAMLKENRIKRHNKSINAPVNMSVRKFK